MEKMEAGNLSGRRTSLRSGRRTIRAVLAKTTASLLIAAAAAGTLGADPVNAATNNPGSVQAGSAFCQTGNIVITTPLMEPARLQYAPSGLHTVGMETNPQRVAFKANLAQWNGSRWVGIREGTWFTKVVGQTYGVAGGGWTDLAGNSLNSLPGFWDLPSGTFAAPIYYAVSYEYYWYADTYRDSGYSTGWAGAHEENRGTPTGTAFYDQSRYGYCKYPGPNWLTNIS